MKSRKPPLSPHLTSLHWINRKHTFQHPSIALSRVLKRRWSLDLDHGTKASFQIWDTRSQKPLPPRPTTIHWVNCKHTLQYPLRYPYPHPMHPQILPSRRIPGPQGVVFQRSATFCIRLSASFSLHPSILASTERPHQWLYWALPPNFHICITPSWIYQYSVTHLAPRK